MHLFTYLGSTIGQDLNIFSESMVIVLLIGVHQLQLREIARVDNLGYRVDEHNVDSLQILRVTLEGALHADVEPALEAAGDWDHALALLDHSLADAAYEAAGY